MRIFVTGGAGFIGSEIIRKIKQYHYNAVSFDINEISRIDKNVKHIKGDIFNIEQIKENLVDCDAVIHMTGLANPRTAQLNPQLGFDLNIKTVQSILELMRKLDIETFIFPSSAAVYGLSGNFVHNLSENIQPTPVGIYGQHKWIAEEICKCYTNNYGLNIITFRIFNAYGKEGHGIINLLTEKAKRNEIIYLYGEEQLRDFVHVKDIADIFIDSIRNKSAFGQTINIGTGTGRKIRDIITLIKEYFPNVELGCMKSSTELYDSVADITKLKKLFKFKPSSDISMIRTTLEEIIANG